MTDQIDTSADNITTPDTTDADVKRKAYSKATTRLRAENPDIWNRILGEEYQKVGIEWKPRPTEAEKAKAEVESLLAKFPELRGQIAGS